MHDGIQHKSTVGIIVSLLWISAYLPDKMAQELPAEQKWAFVCEQEVGIIELTIKTKLLDIGWPILLERSILCIVHSFYPQRYTSKKAA